MTERGRLQCIKWERIAQHHPFLLEFITQDTWFLYKYQIGLSLQTLTFTLYCKVVIYAGG